MKKAIIVVSAVLFMAASAGLGAFCAYQFKGGDVAESSAAEGDFTPIEVSD